MRRAWLQVGMGAILVAGFALVAGAQAPAPSGRFRERGPGAGGPTAGMFEFGGLMGGFGGKVVTGKPILATLTITHVETLPDKNSISNTTTGMFARSEDGSTYRDVKFTAIGPWAASDKAQEFIYIRNVAQGTQYIVNVAKGTYRAFPIRERNPPKEGKRDRPNSSNSSNEVVTDNANGSYIDPVTNFPFMVDDRKVTRSIPAEAIGNLKEIDISSERWYSSDLDLLLRETHTDPRFGTTTYQLTDIGYSPASSLFTPDPSFTQVQGGGFGSGQYRKGGKRPPPPPQD